MPPELPAADRIRHVHFVAVAGTGMGTLACMLAEQGIRVTGSDVAAYPPMSDQLARAGVTIAKGFAPEHALEQRADLGESVFRVLHLRGERLGCICDLVQVLGHLHPPPIAAIMRLCPRQLPALSR